MPWNFLDVTKAADVPAELTAITAACTYVFDEQATQHVDFAGGDGHIHELWWDATGWHHNDLTERTGAPVLSAQSRANGPTGYIFAAEGTQHVVFVGEESGDAGHIHELWWNNDGWHHHDLTEAASAPLAMAVTPGAYVFDWLGTQHVHYVDKQGNIHELWWEKERWHHRNLTKDFGAPIAAHGISVGPPAGYAPFGGNTQYVTYLGEDGSIQELEWKSGKWKHTNLSTHTGAPRSCHSPSAYAFAIGDTRHVNYVGFDGHAHELRFEGTWHWDDLTDATGATPGDDAVLCAYPFTANCTRHVAYTNASGRIHHLWWKAGVWQHDDLSDTSGALLSDFVPLSGYAVNFQRTQHVIYNEIEHLHVCQLWWEERHIRTPDISGTVVIS